MYVIKTQKKKNIKEKDVVKVKIKKIIETSLSCKVVDNDKVQDNWNTELSSETYEAFACIRSGKVLRRRSMTTLC